MSLLQKRATSTKHPVAQITGIEEMAMEVSSTSSTKESISMTGSTYNGNMILSYSLGIKPQHSKNSLVNVNTKIDVTSA